MLLLMQNEGNWYTLSMHYVLTVKRMAMNQYYHTYSKWRAS